MNKIILNYILTNFLKKFLIMILIFYCFGVILNLFEEIEFFKNINVSFFNGLVVDYASRQGCSAIIRGLRHVSDFEFEFQLAHMNRRLGAKNPGGIETVFMMTGEEHFYVSSSLVREIASFGGEVEGLVPELAYQKLNAKFAT